MALERSPQSPFPSATLAVGSPREDGPWLPINGGVSGHIVITNGATPPTANGGATAIISLAHDDSGTGEVEDRRLPQGDYAANGVSIFPFGYAPGAGDGGDYGYFRVSALPPAGQDVTMAAQSSTITY